MPPSMRLSQETTRSSIKNDNLNQIVLRLYDTLSAGQEKNAETINNFFNQKFFKGGGLMYKLCEVYPEMMFTDIEEEGVNLALIQYNNLKRDFKNCLNKISPEIKKAFIQEIFDKVGSEIGTAAPYDQFTTECKTDSFIAGENPDVLGYFQKIVDYLNENENKEGAKKTLKILSNINITNQALNSRLGPGQQISPTMALSDTSISSGIKDSFDALLSFEIGKSASLALNIIDNMQNNLSQLFSNSLPAINTIISEHDEYKYNEQQLRDKYPDYSTTLESLRGEINNYRGEIDRISAATNLYELEKQRKISEIKGKINELEDQINSIRWTYYIMYLKEKNETEIIGNALEELYNNDFDYSKMSEDNLEKLLLKVADLRLKKLFDEGMIDALKLNFGNFEEFETFYKELANPKTKTLHLKNVNILGTGLTTFDLPIYKTIEEGKNLWLKDIDQYGGEAKFFDSIPIRYEIKKSDIAPNQLNISLEDRQKLLNFLDRFEDEGDKYVIKGRDVGLLMYLFFVINNKSPITQMNWEEQKQIEDLFGEAKKTESGEQTQDSSQDAESGEQPQDSSQDTESGEQAQNSSQDTESGEQAQESTQDTIENFLNQVESCGPVPFKNGSEIWLPMGSSKLGDGGYQWMKIKISKVDTTKGTFTGKISGGEFTFANLEGKTKEFKMNQKFLDDLNKISKMNTSSPNKFWLLPDPDNVSFDSFIKNSLRDDSGKCMLGTDELKFPPMDNVLWKDDHFVGKTEEGGEIPNVQYFCTADGKSTYKVEHKKNSFTVSSVFMLEEEGKDGKKESKLANYERNMDWNNFLIFFTQKGLKTRQTKEEADILIDSRYGKKDKNKLVNGRNLKLNWFSINNIKNGFKNMFAAVKKHLDEYDKRKTEDFQELTERRILDLVPKGLGDLFPSLGFAIGQRQEELYAQELNIGWKRISRYLDDLKEDPQFGDTFGETPSHVQWLYGKSYRQYVIDLFKDKNRDTTNDEKRKCAALLLTNIDKGSSPYRNLTEYENQGLWVKTILGNRHYDRFLEDKAKCIQDLNLATETKEKERLQSVLARCEMDYIVNNVGGENYFLPYFNCKEPRGYPADQNKYIPNISKSILSSKFADELKNATGPDGRCSADKINKSYDKIYHGNFLQSEGDFKRFIKSGRTPKALANLKSMIALAKTNDTIFKAKKYFLTFMLSGVLDIRGTKDIREQVYEWGTTIGFLPGMLAKKAGHSQQVVNLLDDFCEEMGYTKFSEQVKLYFKIGDLQKGNVNIDNLTKAVDARWSSTKMEAFDRYSKVIFRSKDFTTKPDLQELQKDVLNPDTENIDNSLLDNKYIINKIGLFSNKNVANSRLEFDHQGKFTGKNDDEKGDKEAFWNKVKEDIESLSPTNIKHTKLVLNQFLNRFNLNSNDKARMFQWIKTANHRKPKIGHPCVYPDGTNMGTITEQEIDSIMRYAIKGTIISERFNYGKVPPEVNDALEAFQKFFEQAFSNSTSKEENCAIYNPEIAEIFDITRPREVKNLYIGSWASYNDVIGPDNKERGHLDTTQAGLAKLFTNKDDIINLDIAKMFNRCETNRQSIRFSVKDPNYETNRAVNEKLMEFNSNRTGTQHSGWVDQSSTEHSDTFDQSPTQENAVLNQPSSRRRGTNGSQSNTGRPREYVRV